MTQHRRVREATACGERITAALGMAMALVASSAAAAERPNIIFIMSDDHASHAISAYGSRVNETPHLDSLSRDGMLFRNAFVTNSICTPSRAAMLTGKYSHLNGVPVFNRFDKEARDDDRFAHGQFPNGVDGTVAKLRGK